MNSIIEKRLSSISAADLVYSSILRSPKMGDYYRCIYSRIVEIKSKIIDIIKNGALIENDRDKYLYRKLKALNIDSSIYGGYDNIRPFDLFVIYNLLHQKQFEFIQDKKIKYSGIPFINNRKIRGVFYTHYSIAYYIVQKCFERYNFNPRISNIDSIKIIDPCLGTGIFIIAMVDYLVYEKEILSQKYGAKELINIIEDSTFGADIDPEALDFFINYIKLHLVYYYGIKIDSNKLSNHIKLGNILTDNNLHKELFGKFDIIFFNPPYELLKPNRSELRGSSDASEIDNLFMIHKSEVEKTISLIKKSGLFRHSLGGMINLFKLFIELSCEWLARPRAVIGFIVPMSILGDYQCISLRKHLIYDHDVNSISIIPEKNDFFKNITQAFCIIHMNKEPRTTKILIRKGIKDTKLLFNEKESEVESSMMIQISKSMPIVSLQENGYKLLKKLYVYNKINELQDEIINARGEIDLTKYKKYITREKTPWPLIRGEDIGYFSDIRKIILEENISYISEASQLLAGPKISAKFEHANYERLACQQISNLGQRRRLKFSLIPKNVFLANSCNYIVICNIEKMKKEYGICYESLLCLLNSALYDWRFKLTSTNNHISNNEIGDLPVPISRDLKWIYTNLENLYKKYKNGYVTIEILEKLIEANVFNLFELTEDEIAYVLKQEEKDERVINEVIDLCKRIKNSYICNHQISSLSKIDLEMVKSIPPGGNWKQIPSSIPSERVAKIRKTGGRTTLYGRLQRNKPSYTVSTYFNRPGNGTFIHPDYYIEESEGYSQHRLISFREAARLQSFKDKFIFNGSKASLLKQIGNAVPPLLSYHLAIGIRGYFNLKKCNLIDLFCGCGGMSYGFKEAGFDVLLGLDNFLDAIMTFKINHPDADIICGDIRSIITKKALYQKLKSSKIDIIIGGPPCQGFSHAGKRIIDDPRNYLFKEFVEIVENIRPHVFVMENVEGILSLNRGKTFESIINIFRSIGYNLIAKKLNAAEYGVPQMRKRVFIIGSKEHIDEGVFPKPLFKLANESSANQLNIFLDDLPPAVTVEEAISDLPFIQEGLGLFRVPDVFPIGISEYQAFMRDLLSFEEFYNLRKKRLRLR